MKKLLYLLIIIIPFITSCEEKETEGISRVTVYAEITLDGESTMFVPKGESFTDPGATSSGGEEVVVSGSVNTNECGFYTLTYRAFNEDGFPAENSRTVIVYEEDEVLGGVYDGTGSGSFGKIGGIILIYPNGDGTYSCTDLLGGYYAQGRGYGPDYAAPTDHMEINGTTITAEPGVSGFGPVALSSGNKDGDVLTWTGTLTNYGLGIGVELVKRSMD